MHCPMFCRTAPISGHTARDMVNLNPVPVRPYLDQGRTGERTMSVVPLIPLSPFSLISLIHSSVLLPPATGKSPSDTMHLLQPPARPRHGRRGWFRRTVHEPSPPRPVRRIRPWKVFFRSSGSQIMNGGKVLSDGVAGFRKTPVTAAGIRLMCMAADCDRSLGIGVTCRSCILSAAYFQCGCDRCLSRRFESPAAWSNSVGPSWGSGLTKKLF